MIKKRYYSPFENDVIVKPQRVVNDPQPPPPPKQSAPARKFKCSNLPNKPKNDYSPLGFMSNIKWDDLIIIGLILLLVFEDNDERDMPLIIGLIILLLIEFIDNEGIDFT